MSRNNPLFPLSGIRDNHHRGTVGDFLKDKIKDGSKLSFVSAYFTIYAFAALKEHLAEISELKFLFGEPRFVKSLDPLRTEKKAFELSDDGLLLKNLLQQKPIARECAEWIKNKVQIRSVRKSNFLHGKMYHIDNNGVVSAIIGSSNFTVNGLGLGSNSNIELNLIVDSDRDRQDLEAWFEQFWNERELVEDVTSEVLNYLKQLYQNNAPSFIYYKTLFHIFGQSVLEQKDSGLLSAFTALATKRFAK